jgi:hypothetical protein
MILSNSDQKIQPVVSSIPLVSQNHRPILNNTHKSSFVPSFPSLIKMTKRPLKSAILLAPGLMKNRNIH